MRRDLLVAVLGLMVLGTTFQARAEVRVVTDRHGSYKMTRVLRSGNSGDVWSLIRRNDSKMNLNIAGYREGDLFPTIRESTVAPHYPWVVWSRFNQGRYDLVWSRWNKEGWNPVRRVTPAAAPLGDDLDADLGFNTAGRPYVVWWRDDGGSGRVFLSAYLNPSWMAPFAVTEPGVDGRHPRIRITGADTLIVSFDTPEGVVEQTVFFELPETITDDINPLDYVFTGSKSIVGEGE